MSFLLRVSSLSLWNEYPALFPFLPSPSSLSFISCFCLLFSALHLSGASTSPLCWEVDLEGPNWNFLFSHHAWTMHDQQICSLIPFTLKNQPYSSYTPADSLVEHQRSKCCYQNASALREYRQQLGVPGSLGEGFWEVLSDSPVKAGF